MEKVEGPRDYKTMTLPGKISGAPEDSAASSASSTFEALFAEQWAPIYRLLARMVGDPSEAEDLALETFYRLHRQSLRERPDFNAAAWLRRVAINLGLHSIRAFRRRLAHELEAGLRSLDEARGDSPMEAISERDERGRTRMVLAAMSSRQSQLLLMRYSGAPYTEIGEALHLSPTSIGPMLVRAEREFARRYRELAQEEK